MAEALDFLANWGHIDKAHDNAYLYYCQATRYRDKGKINDCFKAVQANLESFS